MHYYSNNLIKKLEDMLNCSLTLLIAPSGYGKTTAVHDFLVENIPSAASFRWMTLSKEDPCADLIDFCKESGCPETAEKFTDKDFSSDAFRRFAAELAGGNSGGLNYLVIDNLERLDQETSVNIFNILKAFRRQKNSALKVILIMQKVSQELRRFIEEENIYNINDVDLRLTPLEIMEYYKETGIDITRECAEEIYKYTGGWMVAVEIQQQSHFRLGKFEPSSEVFALMQRLVWDKIGENERKLLLMLAPFDSVKVRQVCYILGEEEMPGWGRELLSEPNFARFDRREECFFLHDTLLELSRVKLREQPADVLWKYMTRAGDWYLMEGKYEKARACYYQVRNYVAMLKVPMINMISADVEGTPFSEIAAEIAACCSEEEKRDNLIPMLKIAYILYGSDRKEEYEILMKELDGIIEKMESAETDDPGKNEKVSELRGEWLLISMFREYPDLEKMHEICLSAAKYTREKPQTIDRDEFWLFHATSPLLIFGNVSGKADEYIRLFSENLQGCMNWTDVGADSLFAAEALYFQGRFQEAKVQLYKTLYLAGQSGQNLLRESADHLLSIIGEEKIVKTETVPALTGLNALRLIERRKQDSEKTKTFLYLPDFERNFSISQKLNAAIERLSMFLRKGRSAQMIGEGEAMITAFKAYCGGVFEGFIRLHMAAGYAALKEQDGAEREAVRAINLFFPDQFYLPYVSFQQFLNGAGEAYALKKYPEAREKMGELKEWYFDRREMEAGNGAQRRRLKTLTKRELEIAGLAARGLRNNEIAEALSLSEKTVRAHLNSVFQKLMIDRRAKLTEYIK